MLGEINWNISIGLVTPEWEKHAQLLKKVGMLLLYIGAVKSHICDALRDLVEFVQF